MPGRVTLSPHDGHHHDHHHHHHSAHETDDGPEFDDAWQAQVLGIADRLVDAGVFSGKQWAESLGNELRLAAKAGAPDNKETYYCAVLEALEKLLNGNGTIKREELDACVEAWREAYLATPHGKPVELRKP